MNMKQQIKPLSGSWRNFTANLSPATKDLFQRIDAKAIENLNTASRLSEVKEDYIFGYKVISNPAVSESLIVVR